MIDHRRIMEVYSGVVILALVAVSMSSAIPKALHEDMHNPHGNHRVLGEDLSDHQHFDGDHHNHHNNHYDHEAFLGKDQAAEFDKLSPEESKHKLGLLYDKMDKDKDGGVTREELVEWIRKIQRNFIVTDAERQWKEAEPVDDHLTFEKYKEKTYGALGDDDNAGNADEDKENQYDYQHMVNRDKKRWTTADHNHDGKLTKEEFADFLHPEDVPHMRELVVDETMEDIDKNKDGHIDIEEYIKDLWPNTDGKEEEPEWVKTEREQFSTYRDHNKDGVMDRQEVKEWIMPKDYDHVESETTHLMEESDLDKDGKLSKSEVLEKYDVFVGSQATDFGEALTRHSEL